MRIQLRTRLLDKASIAQDGVPRCSFLGPTINSTEARLEKASSFNMAPPTATDITTKTTSNGSIALLAANPNTEYPFAHLLPVFDKSEHYPPLTPFEHIDPAARANALPEAEQRTFLKNATRVKNMTPKLGTEVEGIDLTALGAAERDQVALEVARRGLVVFRNQPKFLAQSGDEFKEWGSYFGRYINSIYNFTRHADIGLQATHSPNLWPSRTYP